VLELAILISVIDYLIDFLIDYPIDCLIGFLIDYQNDCPIDFLIDYQNDCPIGFLNDCLNELWRATKWLLKGMTLLRVMKLLRVRTEFLSLENLGELMVEWVMRV
jgi:hypothetical protein